MTEPSDFEVGLNFFNSGKYYEAHEAWEDLWRQTDGPRRQFYQGLIQVAVGLHHRGKANSLGAQNQIRKAIKNMRASSDPDERLDWSNLIAQLEALPEDASRQTIRITRLK